jgi:hypothetical protein
MSNVKYTVAYIIKVKYTIYIQYISKVKDIGAYMYLQ